MASSSGTSSGSTMLQNSGSEEDLQLVMDQRKLKRMQSNRESARRSRMRKQKHLDDLMTQVAQIRKENNQIVTRLSVTTQHYLTVEAENSVLRTQMMELSNRLESLNEIINCMHGNGTTGFEPQIHQDYDCFMKPWNMAYMNQPIMASADLFQY
ncbi:bZIP transcription factor 44-like [Aristolochia californica]|uniref:bZIP transcription factor 44-like n=1 Tax=Aristolochia californica TaxID=171875 RepID=UPI0035DBD27C